MSNACLVVDLAARTRIYCRKEYRQSSSRFRAPFQPCDCGTSGRYGALAVDAAEARAPPGCMDGAMDAARNPIVQTSKRRRCIEQPVINQLVAFKFLRIRPHSDAPRTSNSERNRQPLALRRPTKHQACPSSATSAGLPCPNLLSRLPRACRQLHLLTLLSALNLS